MKIKIEAILQEINEYSIPSAAELEAFRIKYLGSKGILKDLYAELKNVPNEQKEKQVSLLIICDKLQKIFMRNTKKN